MRNVFLLLLSLFGIVLFWSNIYALWQVNDLEFRAAVDRMYENDMTIYNQAETFRPQDYLTREQAAKFFYTFAITADSSLQWDYAVWEDCFFSDLLWADSSLLSYITNICALGFMQWKHWNMRPLDLLTKAEAVAMLVRVDQWRLDESVHPRWRHYHSAAYAMGITKDNNIWNLDHHVTRYEIALMLFRAAWNSIDLYDDTLEIAEVAELLWWRWWIHQSH